MANTYALVETDFPVGWSVSERAKAHGKLKGMGRQTGLPHQKTQTRGDVAEEKDNEGIVTQAASKWIIESETPLTREEIVAQLAEELGKTENVVDDKITYTIFETAQEARDYIKTEGWDNEVT